MNFVNKKRIFSIFLVLILVLILLISSNVLVNHIDLNTIYSSKKENNIFVVGLKCGNNYGVFNTDDQTYYFSKGLFDPNNIKVISSYKTSQSVLKKTDDQYEIIIYSDDYYQVRTIKIIDMPILSVSTNILIPSLSSSFSFDLIDLNQKEIDEYFDINLLLLDNDTTGKFDFYGTLSTSGMMRLRGATSSIFPKKSYKIELNEKKSLLGMNADSDWVLDALYTDKSKIRNMLSYDLWNIINDNQIHDNDLKGEFVELYIDGDYKGLYVLKEKVDVDIACGSSDCFLAKSVAHVSEDVINDFLFNKTFIKKVDSDIYFENYELKSYNNLFLKNFIDKMKNYYSNRVLYEINNNFNLDNYINYNLFIIFIYGTDNVTKNQYLSISDLSSDILITPWDLDLTFGINYSSVRKLKSVEMYYDYDNVLWIDNNFMNYYDDIMKKNVVERYWELRENVITMDVINEYLDSYKELLVSSGAAKRDSDRWYYYDIENEIEKIRTWANNRIQFLDEYFKL